MCNSWYAKESRYVSVSERQGSHCIDMENKTLANRRISSIVKYIQKLNIEINYMCLQRRDFYLAKSRTLRICLELTSFAT